MRSVRLTNLEFAPGSNSKENPTSSTRFLATQGRRLVVLDVETGEVVLDHAVRSRNPLAVIGS